MNDIYTYTWLLWSAGAFGSYLIVWLFVYLLAGGVVEGDPVTKAFNAWSGVLFFHLAIPVIFTMSWLATWFGLVRLNGIWSSPPPAMVGVMLACLAIDAVALWLVVRDRHAFELITPRE